MRLYLFIQLNVKCMETFDENMKSELLVNFLVLKHTNKTCENKINWIKKRHNEKISSPQFLFFDLA
jgi:hypothetical protein